MGVYERVEFEVAEVAAMLCAVKTVLDQARFCGADCAGGQERILFDRLVAVDRKLEEWLVTLSKGGG